MMIYDFKTVLNRFHTGSSKWDEMIPYGYTDGTIIPFTDAEMEFANAPEIVQGLASYVQSSVFAYFDPLPAYYQTVCGWYGSRWHIPLKPEHVEPFCCTHAAISTAIQAFSSPGDSVLVMEPVWTGFLGAIRRSSRKRITHPLLEKENRYHLDFELLEAQLSRPDCKILLFCSPHNPIGKVWTKDELMRIAALCAKYQVTILSDEVHADLTMPGYEHISMLAIPEARQISAVFAGVSKPFNLAGLDTSNVLIMNPDLRALFSETRKKEGLFVPNMLGLKAAELALSRGAEWLRQCVATIKENSDYVRDFLSSELPLIRMSPLEGTYLLWLDFRNFQMNNDELDESLKKEAGLFFDKGSFFGQGGAGFERMNIACPKSVVIQAMNRLRKWANMHQMSTGG